MREHDSFPRPPHPGEPLAPRLTLIRWLAPLVVGMVATLLISSPGSTQDEHGGRSGRSAHMMIGDDLYATGGNVTVPQSVLGDLVAAGGNVTVSGTVNQDAIVAGGSVSILGNVGDDVRAAGGQVVIGRSVGDHVTAAGGSVHLLRESRISGDCLLRAGRVIVDGEVDGELRISGGRVNLNGTAQRQVHVVAERLTIGEGAVLRGDVVYQSPNAAEVSPGAKIEGTLRRAPEDRKRGGGARLLGGVLVGIALFRLIAMLGTALLTLLVFPDFARRVATEAVGNFWLRALIGLVALVFVPVAAVLFILTVIGIPVAAFLGTAYMAFMILAWILSGIVFGALLWRVFSKSKQPRVSVATAVVGILLLHFIAWIPILGLLFAGIVVLATLGSLTFLAFDAVRGARRRPTPEPAGLPE